MAETSQGKGARDFGDGSDVSKKKAKYDTYAEKIPINR